MCISSPVSPSKTYGFCQHFLHRLWDEEKCMCVCMNSSHHKSLDKSNRNPVSNFKERSNSNSPMNLTDAPSSQEKVHSVIEHVSSSGTGLRDLFKSSKIRRSFSAKIQVHHNAGDILSPSTPSEAKQLNVLQDDALVARNFHSRSSKSTTGKEALQ